MADISTEILLECSRDGGRTWSPARGRSMGDAGDYRHRLVWRRNGRYDRFAVFRFSTQLVKKISVAQLTGDVRGGE